MDNTVMYEEVANPGREIAGLGRRLFAIILDGVAIWLLELLIKFVLIFFGFATLYYELNSKWIVELLIAIAYFTYYDSDQRSGSFGKQAMGILVVDENDTPLPVGRAALRATVKVITNLLPPLWFVPVFTKYRQGVHDFAAKSYVIKN
jgi:uncharacterized RDD family membrane protein YckC